MSYSPGALLGPPLWDVRALNLTVFELGASKSQRAEAASAQWSVRALCPCQAFSLCGHET